MAQYSEEVKRLAETLKNSGLAASMTDALERAQNMVGNKKAEEKVEEEPVRSEDVAQTTLNTVKEKEDVEINESEEVAKDAGEIKKEEVFTNKEEITVEEAEPEKKPEQKQKKIDLTDVFNVNK